MTSLRPPLGSSQLIALSTTAWTTQPLADRTQTRSNREERRDSLRRGCLTAKSPKAFPLSMDLQLLLKWIGDNVAAGVFRNQPFRLTRLSCIDCRRAGHVM